MMYLGMLALIEKEFIQNETVLRYLTGHPVSKITIAMFFVGFASLALISKNVFEQFGAEKKTRLDFNGVATFEDPNTIETAGKTECETDDSPFGDASEPNQEPLAVNSDNPVVEQAVICGQQMIEMPVWMHEHYLWKRIVNALHSIYRTGSISNVEDELKYLADMDVERQQQRYSLVRILIWATPMLGFLGTVLGISQALGGISVGPENDFQQMMDGLRGSLYIAFDTTALALTLSMILMFGQFLVDRFETQLLLLVEQRASSEIARNFDLSEELKTPMEKVSDDILESMRLAVESQTEIWRKTITLAENAWSSSLTQVSDQVQEQLSTALDGSVSDLAHYLGEAIGKADDSMSQRWGQWQVTLSDNARLLANQQMRMVDQTELIQQLLVQTDDTSLFEPALNRNRDAIEQTRLLRESLAELSKAVAGMAAQDEADSADQSEEEVGPTAAEFQNDQFSSGNLNGSDLDGREPTPEKLASIIFPQPTKEVESPSVIRTDEVPAREADVVFGSISANITFGANNDSGAASAPRSSTAPRSSVSPRLGDHAVPEIVLIDPSEKPTFAPLDGDSSTYSEVTFTLPTSQSSERDELRSESSDLGDSGLGDSGLGDSDLSDSGSLAGGNKSPQPENDSRENGTSNTPLVIFPASKKIA